MQIETIIQACQAIAHSGKKPSVALVKTKLPINTPLALIIRGLQQYQINPKQNVELSNKSPNHNAKDTESELPLTIENCANRIVQLEAQLKHLSATIISLQAQVKALSQS